MQVSSLTTERACVCCQHIHQCIKGEFDGLLFDCVGDAWPCNAENLRRVCLLLSSLVYSMQQARFPA